MNIASNSVFHFTKRFETLKKILKNQYFIAFYNSELASIDVSAKTHVLTPLVSFCDIPLSTSAFSHAKRYGNYAVGLSREWCEQNKLKPIEYRITNQDVRLNFINEIEKLITPTTTSTNIPITDTLSRLRDLLRQELTFSKPYKDPFNQIINYSDREWRFVPYPPELIIEHGDTKDATDKLNESMNTLEKLKFTYKDIEHVVVSTFDMRDKLIQEISINSHLYNLESKYEVAQFTSKIIAISHIKSDF